MSTEEGPMACAVCHVILKHMVEVLGDRSLYVQGDHEYDHLEPADHDPVPVPHMEVVATYKCDFCGDYIEKECWVIPATSFEYPPYPGAPELIPDRSIGEWVMCAQCCRCVQAKAWGRLHTRQLAGASRAVGTPLMPPEKRFMKRILDLVQVHMTGPPYREF